MILLDDKIIPILATREGKIIELSSFPDAGAPSACVYLCAKNLEEHPHEFSTIFFSEQNAPNLEYLSTLFFGDVKKRFLTVIYDKKTQQSYLKFIADIASQSSLVIIDDFYNFILHSYLLLTCLGTGQKQVIFLFINRLIVDKLTFVFLEISLYGIL